MKNSNKRDDLTKYLDSLLSSKAKDYCYNGLQIQGKPVINKLVTAVSLNLRTIKAAVAKKADAILVHHGLIWGGLKKIHGLDKLRMQAILANDINIYAYHLPLDFHQEFGNNVLFGNAIEANNALVSKANLPIWYQEITYSLDDLLQKLETVLKRKPKVYGSLIQNIHKIGWCTGAAADEILQAHSLGCDTFISGETSEKTPDMALELNMNYIEVGHYASETFGVKALANIIDQNFNIESEFIDLFNFV